MSSSRRRDNNRFKRRDLDKKMGQFLDAGRQFVDGVSGTRPGTKRRGNFGEFSRRNVDNVGRWLTDRVDSFFEEEYEDDWEDANEYVGDNQFKSFSRNSDFYEEHKGQSKRPLDAISLRESKMISQSDQKKLPPNENFDNEWLDDSDLKIDRWRRNTNIANKSNIDDIYSKKKTNSRNLPRSRRRRI